VPGAARRFRDGCHVPDTTGTSIPPTAAIRASHAAYISCAATRSPVSIRVRSPECPGSTSENVDSIAPAARVACPA